MENNTPVEAAPIRLGPMGTHSPTLGTVMPSVSDLDAVSANGESRRGPPRPDAEKRKGERLGGTVFQRRRKQRENLRSFYHAFSWVLTGLSFTRDLHG
jgi:hypothetical protein